MIDIYKVMTFNVRYDSMEDGDHSWRFRKDRVVEVIKSTDPAVIGTQECLPAMIRDLSNILPDYEWVGHGRSRELTDEFCAIFYKKEMLEKMEYGQFWLSETPDEPGSISWGSALPRICTWIKFRSRINQKIEFMVYNTHLDHVSELSRQNAMRLIWKTIAEKRSENGLPVIWMGDFNTDLQQEAYHFLQNQNIKDGSSLFFKNSYEREVGCTYHNFSGEVSGIPIDYILVTSDIEVLYTEIDRRKINNAYPSDHYPVISEIVVLE